MGSRAILGLVGGGALALAILAGCSAVGRVVASVGTPARNSAETPAGFAPPRTVAVRLQPLLVPSRTVQAIVAPYSGSSIATLSVTPYVETATDGFQPISATTGDPTTEDAPDVLRVTQASPSLNLTLPVVFDNLQASRTYRFLARAFGAAGSMISLDASSSADLAVGYDDRPALGTLPVTLMDKVLSATVSVWLFGATSSYDHGLVLLRPLVGGAPQMAIAQATLWAPVHGTNVNFANLKPGSDYFIEFTAYPTAEASPTAGTATASVAITNDDAPAPVTLCIGCN